MKVLAIETSTLTGSIALVKDQGLMGEVTLSVSVQHSERLMPAVEQLLRDAATDLSEIDLFAVADGPGSFTGLRIGIAAAQGFSLATGRPVVGVSTLEGLALNGGFFSGLIVPILDAFRGEVYRAFYRKGAGTFWGLEPLCEDKVVGIPALIAELQAQEGPILLLGNGVERVGEEIKKGVGPERIIVPPPFLMHPRALNIAYLAQAKSHPKVGTISPVLPRYLRKVG